MRPNRTSRDRGFAALMLAAASLIAAPALAGPLCGPSYFVERGDTLFGIADRCGTSVAALQAANPLLDPADMRVGMRVTMPDGADAARTGTGRVSAIAHVADIVGVPVQELIASDGALVASEGPLGPETEYGKAGPGEAIRVTGRLTGDGVECPVLRDSDGRSFSLAGDTDGFAPGDLVTVAGTRADMSFCMQAPTIDVGQITAAN